VTGPADTIQVEVAGRALEARWTAAGDGPSRRALVFLHEGLGSLGLWHGFPDAVRAAAGSPSTLVYSRHGYGRSGPAPLPRPVTYMHHEADVVLPEVLAWFGVERPVLVGHSDGASIALLYAGADHPVSGLVLIAPHVFVEDVTVASIAAARDAFEHTDLRQRLARHHDDIDATFWGWNDVWLAPAFRTWHIEDRLGAITCPVLLVQSAEDPYGTTAQLDAIEAGVRGPVERLLVPGVGHAPHLEAPDLVTALVAAFVGSLDVGAVGPCTGNAYDQGRRR
jgi:pimeloyl-ACP methyl ester carboxylesterase